MGSRHERLWRDNEIAGLFSSEKELERALGYEAALAEAQARSCQIPPEAAAAVAEACRTLRLDEDLLARGVKRDGMIVPELVRQLWESVPDDFRDALHLRSTSQDVIDTITAMAFQAALEVLCWRLQRVIGQIEDIDRASGDVPQMARTRMQRALPFTLHARLEAWTAPLRCHVDRLREFSPRVLVL
jgi:3-carboxy-cis,cis-muconate cycloisomerase